MSNVVAALDRDHANVAKLLELLESEILAIEVGKTPDYSLLLDIMRYMAHYPDRYHHPKEDLIFIQLLKREPAAREDVDDLLEEHVSIGLAGRELNQLLNNSGADSVELREQLGTLGFAYVQTLREHMLKEETKLFPLAMDVLSKEDWQLIDVDVNAIDDPLFGEMIAEEYQLLYELIVDHDFVAGKAGCQDRAGKGLQL